MVNPSNTASSMAWESFIAKIGFGTGMGSDLARFGEGGEEGVGEGGGGSGGTGRDSLFVPAPLPSVRATNFSKGSSTRG